MNSVQPAKQRQTLSYHPDQQFRQGTLNRGTKQDEDEDDVEDDVNSDEIKNSPSIIDIEGPKNANSASKNAVDKQNAESQLRIEERLRKAQEEVEKEVQFQQRQLDK